MGFGDRFQSLKMCIKYALANNLQIYVDWSDHIWSHSGESFYTYFKFVNMPVLNSIDDIPADATVYPAYWTGKLKKTLSEEDGKVPEINLNGIDSKTTFNADVIVYSCIGYRFFYNDSTFIGDVLRVVDPRIIQKVRERQQKYNLATKMGIHLRGTDRAKRIDKTHRMAAMNIRLVNAGILNGLKCIAISDDIDYIEMWKSRYSDFPLLSDTLALGGKEGTHMKSKDSLGVSKDFMNVNLLIDFFTLSSCRSIISTSKDSRFAQEAVRLHEFVNKILS